MKVFLRGLANNYLIIIFMLVVFLYFPSSCRTKKDISENKSNRETIELSDTSVYRYERVNLDWYRINESLLRRDGLVEIVFDSLTSVIVTRENQIQAIGYNPRISSSSVETSKLNIRDSINQNQTTALEIEGSKKKLELESSENSKTKIDKIPSFTPWIGAGLAVAIVLLAVLWYFFRKS